MPPPMKLDVEFAPVIPWCTPLKLSSVHGRRTQLKGTRCTSRCVQNHGDYGSLRFSLQVLRFCQGDYCSRISL